MGQEITSSHFNAADFTEFSRRLQLETALLESWFIGNRFSDSAQKGGLELEAWLIDAHFRPAPVNQAFLQQLNNPLVVPELASFNVEFNNRPQILAGDGLRTMYQALAQCWQQADAVAANLDAQLMMIGTLPTLELSMLTLAQMSSMVRYRALNEQILRLRGGAALELDIHGQEHLRTQHHDVMLESATTSLQIHLKVAMADAAAAFNLSKIISAPMVAACANSPFLLGHNLWAETRIPTFEQAVSVGASEYSKRVTFGIRYAKHSIFECFQANLKRYPILLPMLDDAPPEQLAHLCLHNGSIWRWTRPLIGFDDDGMPHIRIEHRTIPAGPSMLDSIANTAFFFGLMYGLSEGFMTSARGLESDIPFVTAHANFYSAARDGLDAQLEWPQGQKVGVRQLLLEVLLPRARAGLALMDIDSRDIRFFLDIIQARVQSGQNGANWQRQWVLRHGPDPAALVAAYLQRQQQGSPVHEWDLIC
ncbi:glutamate-cysteine ligase family protein [Candidatus Venteria ishoeyi]|uniref:Carboxylate-amine ligase YbdK n=1 Tax=Candidatus Venteria ishoeyi TaxID=1899563 RepID=A0A1H6FGW9_9GAMM|nr:glutamate-cysteine ligase family protein [Candidatus Venteria ishoeyi]MDM8546816.1 glutamate-cysteine ligase family protein [Candidatus Venteria ishoeyi]SEH08406.1 Carboxylate-amine ligase YbdK [Candidatus Venteria ishoeyi]